MTRATHVIKETVSNEGHLIKLWRETQYRNNGLETVFYIDLREHGALVMRQPYNSLNEALDHYYSLTESAIKYGYELHRVKV